MTEVGPRAAHQPGQSSPNGHTRTRVGLTPTTQVVLMSVVLIGVSGAVLTAVPDIGGSIQPGGWWAFVSVAVLYGIFERFVFNVHFRDEGISFSLSEVPTALALVYLSPLLALLARLSLTAFVLLAQRRNSPYKLFFNLSVFVFELSIAILVFRSLNDAMGGTETAMLVAVMVTLVAVEPLTPVLISIAISRFEGGALERIKVELRSTWWLYTVNAVLAVMTLALSMVEPVLALLAILPASGIWFILHSYGDLGQQLRDLDAVHGFAGRVGRSLDPDEISQVAVRDAQQLLRADGAALVRFVRDARPQIASSGLVPVSLPMNSQEDGWRDLLEAGDVRIVERAELQRRAIGGAAAAPAVLIAPIRDDSGVFALLLVVQRAALAHRFAAGDVARMQNMGEQLAASLRRGMLHERLEWEARHDALTALPARTLFERLVDEAVEVTGHDRISAVLMLDLDRFKEVNDTLGHHAGDDLLIQFSQRMSDLLAPGDVLARLAGDEFAVLCHRATPDEIVEFARGCVREGGRPVILDGLEIVVTVSVGVAEITVDDHDAVQPMRRADIAMYNAKWQRTGVEIYRDEIDRRTPARLSMLGDLRTAIEGDELDVVYQPKLDLVSGHVVGVEALVRWTHAGRGIVPPTEFVRVAEDTGLIKDLTDLVLSRGIAMLRRFREAGLPIGLAVNLSTHDLFDSRLPHRVRDYLEANRVEPGALTLEITESSLFVDAPRTRATIDELHAVGIRMAVDDFGTGYSSLSYLRRLPVHELKIDQSFVARMLTDPQDEVIVRSTIDLGHNLDLMVVAEGVESLEVLARLGQFGCDIAQGFCISQPIAADLVIDWLQLAASARTIDTPTDWVGTLG